MRQSTHPTAANPSSEATDDELLRRPIIVVGAAGRSGTSIMAKYLSFHPALAYLEEPRVIWRYGNERKSDMFRREDARPEVKRHIRREFARRVREAGGVRMIEKTPGNALRMEFVDEVFPDAQFIHILRNGRNAVLGIEHFWTHHSRGVAHLKLRQRLREVSLSQLPYYGREFARRVLPRGLVSQPTWGPQIPGLAAMAKELDTLDVACLQWRISVEAACHAGRRLPPDRYLEVRLEDFSHELLSRAMEFCGLEDDPAVHQRFDDRFQPNRAGARSAQASPEVLEQIDRWIEPTQRWLGYE